MIAKSTNFASDQTESISLSNQIKLNQDMIHSNQFISKSCQIKSNWLKAAYYLCQKTSIELILIMYIVMWKINIKSHQKCCPDYIMGKALLHFPSVFVLLLFLFVFCRYLQQQTRLPIWKGRIHYLRFTKLVLYINKGCLSWGWLVLDFVLGHPLVALILTSLHEYAIDIGGFA